MNEVIARLLEAESQARQIVNEAREQAKHLTDDSRARSLEMTTAIQQETREETERIIAEAIQKATAEKREILSRYAAGLDSSLHRDAELHQQAVATVIQCVCNPG